MASLATTLLPTASADCVEEQFESFDGVRLFYRHWRPAVSSDCAILLFHRGHEHSGRYQEFVKRLDLPACHIFAWDARGHGRSPGERGYAEDFPVVVRDMDCFVRFLSREHHIPVENMVVLGHSVAAVGVSAWVHDYAPPIRAMVLVTPAFRVKLYVPLALPALRLRNRLGKSFIKSYVKATMLTHDLEEARRYAEDPLISRSIATNILLDLHDTATRLMDDAAAIHTPILLLTAGADWVVKNSASHRFFNRLASPTKEIVNYEGFYHAILHEKDREKPIAKIRQFIHRSFEHPTDSAAYLDADKAGYTRSEFDSLSRPLTPLSPHWCNFTLQKISLRTLCTLSQGIRLGWRTGFDSGESLDYVYRNSARGITPLGQMIDRIYLNSIGWIGIRVRKQHLQEALRHCIRDVYATGEHVQLVDIAAGGARYALDVLKELDDQHVKIDALFRDRSESALSIGRETAVELGLKNVSFAPGDAFDSASLARIQPRPNIAIVSGLYELFGDNSMIRASLEGLAEAVAPGGFLIYTNQPWHPQIEMIARVLINRDGKPWIMRRRTQAEMDALVRAAGFGKQTMTIDKFGIFTVSVARRMS